MTKDEFIKSKCYKCRHGGFLDRLGWVDCFCKTRNFNTNRSHLLPVWQCDLRENDLKKNDEVMAE